MIQMVLSKLKVADAIARVVTFLAARACWFLRIGLLSLSANATVHAQSTFTPLGFFGGFQSQATDLSDDGSVVVGTVFDGPATQSGVFRWTATASMVRPGDIRDNPAISADGSVVVGTVFLPPLQAFRWSTYGSFQTLGGLPGQAPRSRGHDASQDGSVVVGYATGASDEEAFRWTEATGIVGLGDLPGGTTESRALSVSGDGAVVVGHSIGVGNRAYAFRWTSQSGMVELPELPGAVAAQANKVSADGAVAVGVNFFPPPAPLVSSRHAVRWTESEGVVSLGHLPGTTSSVAYNVSADGSVIVGDASGRDANGNGFGGAFY